MTFAAPLFLLAALAAVIPLLLHLIHRRQAQEVPFSTLRFLKVSVQRTRRRKYLDDLALLIARMAALVLIAVGLSGPAVHSLKALWGRGRATAVAVVLDNSASMAAVEDGRPRFEAARQEAEQVLGLLREGDPVALFLTGGPPSPEQGRLYHTPEAVRQALAQARVSLERADLPGKLRQARALLARAEAPNKEIYVITDNQAVSWEGLDEPGATAGKKAGPAAAVPVVLLHVGRGPVLNAAVRGLRLQSPAPVAGVPVQVVAEVVNTSAVPEQKHLELYVNSTREAVSPTLTLPPGGSLSHEFRFTPHRAGVHKGEVKLAEEDGLPLDNHQFFAVLADQQVPVAVVKPRRHEIPIAEETFYLERALAPGGSGGGAIRATALTPRELVGESLAGFAVIFCVDLPAPEPALADRLRDYVRGGGHLFWVCGPNVDPDAYNRMNEQASGELLPAPLEPLRQASPGGPESWHVAALDPDDPALAPLTEPASLYESVLVSKHFPLTWGKDSGGRVLARLDDGRPLLAEKAVGPGSVLLLGTGVTLDWTNLPLRPLFLPLLARLTFRLAGAEADRAQVLAGAPVTVPLGAGPDGPSAVEVVRPSGALLRLHGPDQGSRALRYDDTHEAGVYLFRTGPGKQPRQIAVAVNVDPAESDPATLSRAELQRRFGARPLLFAENPEDLPGLVRRLREGKGLWEWFLAAVLVVLVFESFLANRKRPAEPAPPPAPDRERQAAEPLEESVADFLAKL